MGTGIRRDTVPASKQNFVRGADGASVPLSSNQQATSARHAVITLDDSHAVIPRLLKVPGEVRGVQSSDSAGLEGFSKVRFTVLLTSILLLSFRQLLPRKRLLGG
ncbi:hypothetical protein ACOSP7_008284 [Xanthoceras sorbifolium]